MALFGSKTKKQTTVATGGDVPARRSLGVGRDLSQVLKHARVTEKATMHSADGVYTFDVATGATKRDIMQAVRLLYKVTPRKVRVVTVRAKTVRSRRTGQMGVKGGGKKAYIYLKKGETITIA